MGDLTCQSNPEVPYYETARIKAEGAGRLAEASPIADREILSKRALKERAGTICEETGLCRESKQRGRTFDMGDYARQVTTALIPPTGTDDRVFRNIGRLFASRRIQTGEIVSLVRLMENRDEVTAFREAARDTFARHRLFYYDYVPYCGAVVCFREAK